MTTEYYDIHTHILPGVDDGAKDLEETRQMLMKAKEEGIRHIIATPHYVAGEKNPSREQLQEALEATRKAAKKIDSHMTVSLGNELLDSPGILSALQRGDALTMGETRYILVEFLPKDSYSQIYHSLSDYIMAGYIPIVAHMERYEVLWKEYDYLDELIKLGVYFQMNGNSLMGAFWNPRAAYHRRLLELGYIHFLGSDCHGSVHRPPMMQRVLKKLHKNWRQGKRIEEILISNPEKMLQNRVI